MKRLALAALAAVGLWVTPAGAQTTFRSSGLLTSVQAGPQPDAISTPFSLTVLLGTPATNVFTSGDYQASGALIEGGSTLAFSGTATLTQISNTDYRIQIVPTLFGSPFYSLTEEFFLGMPGLPQAGPVALTSASNIRFDVGHATTSGSVYTLVTAVPEASIWAMMIVGLGAIGAAARRRRSVAQPMPIPLR